jgi:heme A synthase
MANPQLPRSLVITVIWTLGLLLLGSVVHATESSLACPDWPTCFGTMMPEMKGGVFWEHLHRLVAGGLILVFSATAYLGWKEGVRYRWMWKAMLAGIGLLLIQAVLGGITVLLRLPAAVSSAHLGLAFLFLALATVLAVASRPGWAPAAGINPEVGASLSRGTLMIIALAFIQSLVGAVVRHTDAGMACPDVPFCLGALVPPLDHPLVALHFSHRVLGVVLLGSVLWLGHVAFRRSGSPKVRLLGVAVALVAGGQLLLGFFSVYSRLAVAPVSLHTLFAAVLLVLLVSIATMTWVPGGEEGVG